MTNLQEKEQLESYQRALKKVKKLRGFYTHLAIYIVINIMILGVNIYYSNSSQNIFQFKNFSTLFFWGIGLTIHALSVFIPNLVFSEAWEEKKIKKIIERNKQNKL